MKIALRYFLRIVESYLFIVVAAIALGLWFPETFSSLSPYTTFLLQIIFFFSSLKLDTSELVQAGKQWKTLLAVNVVVLIVLPVVVYGIATWIIPDLALALVFLAAMPAGMSLPLMVDVIAGDRSLALLLTISSALLAPLTVPLVLSQLTSTSVQLPLLDMAWKLFLVIVIPFVAAQLVRRVLPAKTQKIFPVFKPISLALLGLLIAASVAINARAISGASSGIAVTLAVLFVFFIAIHLFSHLVFYKKRYREQVTIAASVTFMNFTLAIYLASLYAPQPQVLLTLVLSIIPWAILLIPFKFATDKMKVRGWIE